MPRAEQVSDFHCVTGWSSSNVRWAGVRITRRARAGGSAKQGVSRCVRLGRGARTATRSRSQQALLPDVMLAYEMDGKPLSRPHGAPVRLVMPEMYGYKSVKWVNQIELGTTLQTGYWEQNGYDKDAWLGRSNGFWRLSRRRAASSASPAPSGRSTGRTRRPSSRCSRRG